MFRYLNLLLHGIKWLHLQSAGNEAFQAGRHSEAIEHYTAALSRNVESRSFAAICFCNRAAAYKALGQVTDAIADCSLAIALDGNYLKVSLFTDIIFFGSNGVIESIGVFYEFLYDKVTY